MKRALIIGVAGQDGYYLTHLLVSKGYAVYGVDRLVSSLCSEQREALSGVAEIDLSQAGVLAAYARETAPDEIYYLAAHHFSSQGEENRLGRMAPFLSVNLIAANEALELIQTERPRCRFFYAASSHIFGTPDVSPQTETTPYRPDTPYGVSKTAAVLLCRYYREVHKLYTVAGILYNHESPRRSAGFVTTQIARAAALAACGSGSPLILKDLNFVVDWGAAEDYVDAMWRTLQQSSGDEYIIATGIPRTVGDFAREAFGAVGLKSEEYVHQQPDTAFGKNNPYIGDNSKIKRMCGWEPTKAFASLVKEMVDAQLLLKNRV
jgi:GDPmannose 4,6-dehydratase